MCGAIDSGLHNAQEHRGEAPLLHNRGEVPQLHSCGDLLAVLPFLGHKKTRYKSGFLKYNHRPFT